MDRAGRVIMAMFWAMVAAAAFVWATMPQIAGR